MYPSLSVSMRSTIFLQVEMGSGWSKVLASSLPRKASWSYWKQQQPGSRGMPVALAAPLLTGGGQGGVKNDKMCVFFYY
uniref:Uncharacterized protein n=1 Tax=Mastacembelus armatus TaxID=205130 RepID=A0A7N8WR13_9TELE